VEGQTALALRRFFELSRRQFANLLGVTPRNVERWEKGEVFATGPQAILLEKLRAKLLEHEAHAHYIVELADVCAKCTEESGFGLMFGLLLDEYIESRVRSETSRLS
jgi:transcriptional regulator with XRE-family HTH domain